MLRIAPDINQEIGARVKARRERLRINQDELADALGLQRSALSRLETGSNTLNVLQLVTIAAELRTTVSYLVGEISEREIAEGVAISGYADLSDRDRAVVVAVIQTLSSLRD